MAGAVVICAVLTEALGVWPHSYAVALDLALAGALLAAVAPVWHLVGRAFPVEISSTFSEIGGGVWYSPPSRT